MDYINYTSQVDTFSDTPIWELTPQESVNLDLQATVVSYSQFLTFLTRNFSYGMFKQSPEALYFVADIDEFRIVLKAFKILDFSPSEILVFYEMEEGFKNMSQEERLTVAKALIATSNNYSFQMRDKILYLCWERIGRETKVCTASYFLSVLRNKGL